MNLLNFLINFFSSENGRAILTAVIFAIIRAIEKPKVIKKAKEDAKNEL